MVLAAHQYITRQIQSSPLDLIWTTRTAQYPFVVHIFLKEPLPLCYINPPSTAELARVLVQFTRYTLSF
jgi:hypothetical protein